jgi:DNA (cytosine-5)-methyltransferase 1
VGDTDDAGSQRWTRGQLPERAGQLSPWAADSLVWLPCRDGRLRPTQSGLQPLATGVPNRVGTLRGAGNAVVPQVAAAFIHAYQEVNA